MTAALPVHRRQASGLAECRPARAAGGNRYPVGELRQLDELPPVQRQLNDLPMIDDLADFGIRRVQQAQRCADGDRIRHRTDAQNDWNGEPLTDVQVDAGLRDRFETVPIH